MLEWSSTSGLLVPWITANDRGWKAPQVFAVSPADGYANGAPSTFTIGILEPTWGGTDSVLYYTTIDRLSLYVDGVEQVFTTTDPTTGSLWTTYNFSYTPTPSTTSYPWNVRAESQNRSDESNSAANLVSWGPNADADGLGNSLSVATNIMVTDSVGTTDDLEMNYGNVDVGTSSASQAITVTNQGATTLNLSDTSYATLGAGAFAPFDLTDNCSGQALGSSSTCSVDIVFLPTAAGSFGKILRINSDDATVSQVSVAMCGTSGGTAPRWTYSTVTDTSDLTDSELLSLLSDCAVPAAVSTAAPTEPELLYPSDGDANVPTSVNFAWTESTDADGDAVTYQVCYAPEDEALEGSNCYPATTTDVTKGSSSTLYAGLGSGAGLLLFGMMLAGSARRRKLALLIGLMAITAMFLVSCGKSTTDTSSNGTDTITKAPGVKTYSATLQSGTDYTWKVIASDGTNSTDSETASFTTGGN